MNREMKIAIIDNSIDPCVYAPVPHWDKHLNAEWKAFRATEDEFPDLDDGFTHMVLTGSEATILERDEWACKEIDLIGEAAEAGMPILGSCWGHQILAVAFAGESYVRRSPQPEVGWYEITIRDADCLFGRRGRFFVFNSHFDEVISLGSDFAVLASSENCKVHAFRLKNKPVWGIQSHPEIGVAAAREYLKANVSRNHPASDLFRKALRSRPRDSGLIRDVVSRFMKYAVD